LQAVEDNLGEKCPGERDCFELKKPGLENPDTTCPDCPFYATKPGREPEHVTLMLHAGIGWDESFDIGFTPNSIDQLTPFQWCCVRGLRRGRKQFEDALNLKRRKEDAMRQR
jgi:hypothetical protein